MVQRNQLGKGGEWKGKERERRRVVERSRRGEHMNNVVTAQELFLQFGSDAANANG
jgi:hypothetical protein